MRNLVESSNQNERLVESSNQNERLNGTIIDIVQTIIYYDVSAWRDRGETGFTVGSSTVHLFFYKRAYVCDGACDACCRSVDKFSTSTV